MNLPQFALNFRPVVLTVVGLLMVWGIFNFATMPRREDPEYTVRTCVVVTAWPGVPAEKIEQLVTYPLEQSIDSIDRVDKVRSTTTVGLSTIYVDVVETEPASSIDNVWDKVRANVAKVPMPETGLTPIVNDEFGDTNIMLLSIYQTPLPGEDSIRPGDEYSPRELEVWAQRIRDEVRFVEGVAKVELHGVQQEAVYIETDLGTWSQLNLTSDQLEQLVESRNVVTSSGTIETDIGRFSVNSSGEFDTVTELNAVIVDTARSSAQTTSAQVENSTLAPVYLRDLGVDVVRDYQDPPATISRFTDANRSQPSVIVAFTMKSGGNISEICAEAKRRIAAMQEEHKALPPDLAVVPVSDQSTNVNAKIESVVGNVISAILIVVVVVYLIVGFRSAAVMAANIPVVVLITVGLLPSLGVDLEQISLASIIIALGLLVDNAVQVSDQCRTNQLAGMSPNEATIVGTNQVSMPMLVGTATTVSAFLPMLVALIGSKREYVYSLPVTLSVTLGVSWIMAMTFCSILAARFIRPPKDPSRPSAPLPRLVAWMSRRFGKKNDATSDGENLFLRLFGRLAEAALKFKFVTVGIAVVLLIGALNLPVASEFFPQDERDQFYIDVWLPENASLEQSNEVAMQVESILQALSPGTDAEGNPTQRILGVQTSVGGGLPRWYMGRNPESQQPNYAEILIRTTDPRFTPELVREVTRIAERGDKKLGIEPIVGTRVIPRELALGPPVDAPVEFRVTGTGQSTPGFADLAALEQAAATMRDILESQPDTWDVHDTMGAAGYELRVDVNEDQAHLSGVTNLNVARTLNAYFSGQQLTTFREGDQQIPVYLRLQPEQRGSLAELDVAFVEGHFGKVPLNSLASVTPRWEPARIQRRELNRVIEVRAQVDDGVMANDVVARVTESEEYQQLLADLPSGYRVEIGGTQEKSDEGREQMTVCFAISLLLIVICLVIQYNGWAKPVIILTTLPMALIGALPGLAFTGYPLGFMPQLGLLSLFGIVLNTAIIFFEFADQFIHDRAQRSDGSGPILGLTKAEFRNCLVDAAKQRLLPIFLTTATTIGGLFPLALAGGPLWEGMAWLMIFGLTVATLLTLLVVPALYVIFVETFRVQPIRLKTER